MRKAIVFSKNILEQKEYANNKNSEIIFIVANEIGFDKISGEIELLKGITILDISHLLYLVRENDILKNKLISLLNFL